MPDLVGHIRLDNGPEFTAKAIRDWLDRLRVKTLFIEPGVAMLYRGVMPRYVKTLAEVSDLEVLAKHPYAAMWKMMMPFLSYLLQYEFCVQFINIERN